MRSIHSLPNSWQIFPFWDITTSRMCVRLGRTRAWRHQPPKLGNLCQVLNMRNIHSWVNTESFQLSPGSFGWPLHQFVLDEHAARRYMRMKFCSELSASYWKRIYSHLSEYCTVPLVLGSVWTASTHVRPRRTQLRPAACTKFLYSQVVKTAKYSQLSEYCTVSLVLAFVWKSSTPVRLGRTCCVRLHAHWFL